MKKNSTVVLRQENPLSPDALIEALSGSIITQPDGVVIYLNAAGKPHRTAGPAIVYPDGTLRWCRNGVYHRTDGPAVEFADGFRRWFINGTEVSEAEHARRRRLS